MVRRTGWLLLSLAAALWLYACFQPDHVDANGWLIEPFGYRVASGALALIGWAAAMLGQRSGKG